MSKPKYKHLLFYSAFPDEWKVLYKALYKRLVRYYTKERDFKNPTFEIILEKIAYLATKLKYAESIDTTPQYSDKYSRILRALLSTLEQLMKYTEVVVKKTETVHKEISKKSDKELEDEIKQLIGGGKGKIKTFIGGKAEA